MGTNVTTQNAATNFRTQLAQNIYVMNNFHEILKSYVAAFLPIFNYEIGEYITKIKITINRNACTELQGFVHNKEFYVNIFKDILIATLRDILNRFLSAPILANTPNLLYSINLLNNVIESVTNDPLMIYRLFDITAVLNNEIIVYL